MCQRRGKKATQHYSPRAEGIQVSGLSETTTIFSNVKLLTQSGATMARMRPISRAFSPSVSTAFGSDALAIEA